MTDRTLLNIANDLAKTLDILITELKKEIDEEYYAYSESYAKESNLEPPSEDN